MEETIVHWESDGEEHIEEFFNSKDRSLVRSVATDETACILDVINVN